jgi:hypothetical protein
MSALRKSPLHPAEKSATVRPKPALEHDILWGQPVFKAPELPNPRVVFDPLPFTATRVTHAATPSSPR